MDLSPSQTRLSDFHLERYMYICKSIFRALSVQRHASENCRKKTKEFCVNLYEKSLPRWLGGKEFACQCRRPKRHGFAPWVGKIPWKRA